MIASRALALFITLLASTAAHALLFRAYVASDGNDANPCTLASPCRLLPAAFNAVQDGGEIWMLDSANYNTATVNIAKSVTILAIPGAVGSVVATGGPAIIVAASGLVVTLRNLVMVPLPASSASYGIYVSGASRVNVEGSHISGMPSGAIYAVGLGAFVNVVDSTIRGNSAYALTVLDGANADLQASKLLDNTLGGIHALATAFALSIVTVSDCVIAGGSEGAFAEVSAAATGTAKIIVTRSTINRTTYALDAETQGTGFGTVVVSYSTVVQNSYANYVSGVGAGVYTLQNNHISDNATASGSLTPLTLQ